ncbi:MAG: tetratricopeptide repeat protein [Burkholderiales bacterium]|nr:tetratricopeptide repeat protein [Burkholderiales bacterium]
MNSPNTDPLAERLAAAKQLHGAGNFTEAEACYRSLLADAPNHAGAACALGVLLWQLGRLNDAWDAMQLATELAPDVLPYLCIRGQLEAAVLRWAEAEASFSVLVHQDAASLDGWIGLGGASYQLRRYADAIDAYRRALDLQPGRVETINDLALALEAGSLRDEAIRLYREGLSLHPDFIPLYNNLGNALVVAGQPDEGADILLRALQLAPTVAELWFNYANALAVCTVSDQALSAYRRVLELDAGHVKAHINLANVLRARGDLAGAVGYYREAIALDPRQHDAYSNMSATLLGMGKVDEAIEMLEQALVSKPDSAIAYNNLGNALKDAARLDEAIAAYRHAVAIDPGNMAAYGNLLYTLSFHPGYDDPTILAEAQLWAAQQLTANQAETRPGPAADMAGRKIRIGYVSPNFRNHCQALFMMPLLANHDRQAFEIYCYAQLARADEVSDKLARHADVWRLTYGWSDERLADQIEQDGIDILVDLTMHMSDGRQQVFARRPAPVQIAWLAYPGTTGNPAIQYRLSDPWLDPVGYPTDQYSETTLRLPDTFWCYDPLCDDLQPNTPPVLATGHVTFGCLNNFCKVSDASLSVWARVLARVPGSRLLLLSPMGGHRLRVLDRMTAQGVEASRVEFVEYRPRRDYLQTYHRIDICLDTLPYNGHTTSLDAYWMGVPVVTQVGTTVAGRAGWSQLNNLGLPELAAADEAGFVDVAVKLATDIARLAALRTSLRGRMQCSPLMDAPRFTAAIESIYRSVRAVA